MKVSRLIDTMIRLVIFDLWNTLAFKRFPSLEKMRKITRPDLPYDEFTKVFESSVQLKRWRSKRKAYRNFLRNLGLRASDRLVEDIKTIRDDSVSTITVFDHSIPLLKELKEKGYSLGLITNSSIFSIRSLELKSEVIEYFDYPQFSFDIGRIKPDPVVFLRMLRRSRIKPSEALMIGDNYTDDIIPSKRLGLHAIHFKTKGQLNKDLRRHGIRLQSLSGQ